MSKKKRPRGIAPGPVVALSSGYFFSISIAALAFSAASVEFPA